MCACGKHENVEIGCVDGKVSACLLSALSAAYLGDGHRQ